MNKVFQYKIGFIVYILSMTIMPLFYYVLASTNENGFNLTGYLLNLAVLFAISNIVFFGFKWNYILCITNVGISVCSFNRIKIFFPWDSISKVYIAEYSLGKNVVIEHIDSSKKINFLPNKKVIGYMMNMCTNDNIKKYIKELDIS
mgnify:CR=1 FL=1